MKKLVCLFLLLSLFGCSSLPELPLPEVSEGSRGELGIDANINEATIDQYLGRSDSIYRDCRMLKDEANFEAIGIDSNIDGFVKGFEIVPYPYLCNVTGLPEIVGDSYSGPTLFTVHEDGSYTANYEESLSLLHEFYPQDKIIFLMCGGGGYAGMTKTLLVSQGYDADKIYNTGGYVYYEGENAVITKQEDGTYDYSEAVYHDIDFSSLTAVEGYDPDANVKIVSRAESVITELSDQTALEEKINAKEDFLLLVYLDSCTSCAAFRPVVEEIASSDQYPVYGISIEAIEDLIPGLKYTPSLVIFKEGEVLAFLDANADEDLPYYKNAKELSSWIGTYIAFESVEGSAENNETNCGDSACSF